MPPPRLTFPGLFQVAIPVRVRAINAAEISSGWGYSEETPLTGKVGDPPMPLNFRAATLVFGIKLNWEFGKFTEDTLKTEIQHYSAKPMTAESVTAGRCAVPVLPHELAGLAAGTAFYFRARPVDKIGTSPLDLSLCAVWLSSMHRPLLMKWLPAGRLSNHQRSAVVAGG